MDINKIQKLPVEEQRKVLQELKDRLSKDREDLKNKVRDLEKLKKEKEQYAKNLATAEKKETLAEVSLIVGSIKNVRNELHGRNRDLQFIEKAVKQAERLLKVSEEEIDKKKNEERKLKLLTDELRERRVTEGRREQPGLRRIVTERTPTTTGIKESELEETISEEAIDEVIKEVEAEEKSYTGRIDFTGQEKAYIAKDALKFKSSDADETYASRAADRPDYSSRTLEAIQEQDYQRKTVESYTSRNAYDEQDTLEAVQEYIDDQLSGHKRKRGYER